MYKLSNVVPLCVIVPIIEGAFFVYALLGIEDILQQSLQCLNVCTSRVHDITVIDTVLLNRIVAGT